MFVHVLVFFSTIFGFQGGLCSSKALSSTKIHLEGMKEHQKYTNRNFRQSLYISMVFSRFFWKPRGFLWYLYGSLWQYHPFLIPSTSSFPPQPLPGLEGEHGGSQIVAGVKPHGLGEVFGRFWVEQNQAFKNASWKVLFGVITHKCPLNIGLKEGFPIRVRW